MAITEIYVGRKDFKKSDGSTPVIVYKFEGITSKEAQKLCEEFLVNPITQRSIDQPPSDNSLEISYKPGIMNPVEESLMRGAKNLGINPIAVATSRVYFFDDEEKVSDLFVSQVEEIVIEKKKDLLLDHEGPLTELVKVRGLDERELVELSKKRSLFLDSIEMKAIQRHFNDLGRDPTDCEIEAIAQTWSEHNGHKTFKAELVTPEGIIKKSAISRIKEASKRHFRNKGAEVVTAFSDNSGGIRFYDGYVIIAKGETHNSPVAIEPVGGSETKLGGLFRDIVGTGKGGKNLFAIVVNNFADPTTKDVNEGCLYPRQHLEGNTKGESSYGNKMGIPTLGMIMHFHPDFGSKPTSMGIAVGIIEEDYAEKGEPQVGDFLVTVGGRTGKDGVHGATFSSGDMTADTKTVHSTAVQMGNAIEQKRMFDALEECKYADLIRAITDCGGGGYSSAIGEMGEKIGVEVNLDLVPLKYKGLAPWEIWLSESQERMVVVIDPKNWEEFRKICEMYEVPATVIGSFTGDRILRLKYKEEVVGELTMDLLHNGIPKRTLEIIYEDPPQKNEIPEYPTNWVETYKKVLGHLNICSKEPIFRRYDHSVGGRTFLKPLMGINQDVMPDASVVKPLFGRPYGIVTACALNPNRMRIDPYEATIDTFADAAVNYVSVGADIKEAAALDNYVWPSPNPRTLGALDLSVDALTLMIDALKIPVVSGKDSLSGTFRNRDGSVVEIPYTLNITIFGKVTDVYKCVTPEFKKPGSIICYVGGMNKINLGGSIYFETCGKVNTNIPIVDLEIFPGTLEAVHRAIEEGRVRSCKAVGEGGIAAALANMCFASGLGAVIELGGFGVRDDFAFFDETPGFLIELPQIEDVKLFAGVPHKILGVTTEKPVIKVADQIPTLFSIGIDELREAWKWKY